jgi:succinate dehydrogenase / fumarate reductase, membrane anchor subunit
MVTNVTSLGRSGLSDWLIQRISAVVLLAWFVFVGGFIAMHSPLTFAVWQGLFTQTWMRIFTLIALLALCAHAWIGMWTIFTDYFSAHLMGKKATTLRLLFQLGCIAVLLVYLLWCIHILWSI